MYSNSHITMGTSSDDLFDKSGKNQNSLHYKYNKFLTSPYLERKYNNYYANPIFENQKNDEGNKNYIDLDDNYDSFGETNIYYPKPNYYNNIYTQRFSKKYKRFYNYNNLTSNYMGNNTDNGPLDYYNNQNRNINSRNNRFKKEHNINKLKTPEYQIKKLNENNQKIKNELRLEKEKNKKQELKLEDKENKIQKLSKKNETLKTQNDESSKKIKLILSF